MGSVPALAVLLLAGAPAGDAEPSRPHILVAVADDWSWPHAGAYGCRWIRTPAFDRVARNGILFTHAYTPNAKCAPSRAAILTGRNSWQLEEAANHMCYFPEKFKTYAEALAENGYHAGFTCKGWAPGVPGSIDGRPRRLTGIPYNRRKAKPPARGISNNDYAANFRDFLDARPAGKPFLFWYGSVEPHRGYEYGSGVRLGSKRPSDVDRVPACWPDDETVRTDLLDYAFEVEHFDRHLAAMLDLLAERGLLDDTLVLVTADNGMPFPRAKGQMYDCGNHLPLAIQWTKGIRAPGRVIDDFVSFIDFAPTFLEVGGLSERDSGMQPIQGRSLIDLLRSERSGIVDPSRDHVLVGKERHDVGRPNDVGYPIRGIVKDGFLFLRNFEISRWPVGNPETGYLNCDGSPTKTACIRARRDPEIAKYWDRCLGKRPAEELYDLGADPDCVRNLAADPARAAIKAGLEGQLLRELKAQGDPRIIGDGRIFDEYPYSDESTRHFYERYLRGEKIRAGWVNDTDFDAGAATPQP